MQPAEFESVIEAARAGAEWAWSRLHGDLSGPVLGYLQSRGAVEAEDLLGEVFIQVARNIGEKHELAKNRCYSGLSGYQKLIADKVDAVFCETPPYCFPDHVTAAIDAGCHVYLAKPVACDPWCHLVSSFLHKVSSNG